MVDEKIIRSKRRGILRRRCDRPMAVRKKLLPCERNCRECFACINLYDDFSEGHNPDKTR